LLSGQQIAEGQMPKKEGAGGDAVRSFFPRNDKIRAPTALWLSALLFVLC
jgi:hypothetical protein